MNAAEFVHRNEEKLEAFAAVRSARGRLLALTADQEHEAMTTSFAVPLYAAELIEAQNDMRFATERLQDLLSFDQAS